MATPTVRPADTCLEIDRAALEAQSAVVAGSRLSTRVVHSGADEAVEKVKKSGGKLVGEILDIPNVGRYARVQDAEGNVIGVIKPIMP